MADIIFFNIPAHGHTNPTIEVVRALVGRGHRVRYYTFSEFEEKLRDAGAEVILCDDAMPPAPDDLHKRVGRDFSLLMEMVIAVTEKLHGRIAAQIESGRPDCIVTDSVCIWGKLFAQRFGVPLVCSTTTLAFNRHTAWLMKQNLGDVMRMVLGIPKMAGQLRRLAALGYEAGSVIELIQNDNETDTIVYTSRLFQPMAETFSDRYVFVGPSVSGTESVSMEKKRRPLVYISLGTVLNNNARFYHSCIEALQDMDCDVVMSVGLRTDIAALGGLPRNIRIYPHVNQMEVLARADAFVTRCGMNSVMESLSCGVPMVLYPQHAEERAVANRAYELGAGVQLGRATAKALRRAVSEVLDTPEYREAACRIAEDFRGCGGAEEAADFIEKACRKSF